LKKKKNLSCLTRLFIFKGVIAIDDISFDDGACNKAICDFETPEICGYLNDPAGDFDWTRNKGPTASFETGYFFLNFYFKKVIEISLS